MKLMVKNAHVDAFGSLPVRGAWIEIDGEKRTRGRFWSLPVRGAWIEMGTKPSLLYSYQVAPRAGSVD